MIRTPPTVYQNPPIRRVVRPFREFARVEASGGIVLLACTVIALLAANSPWSASYLALWQTRVTVGAEGLSLSKPLILWINDGLMALFFFVVGLEIKREVLVGELANLRKAALPIAAAIGGMVVPALFYVAVTAGTASAAGWGVPMATDIAFALGVLALLGRRAPLSLKVFLTALAIVDDIGAVLVIAVFYTSKLSIGALVVGLALVALLFGFNRLGIRNPLVYALVSVVVWVAFIQSGVHATIAGILVAMTIPAWVQLDTPSFLARARVALAEIEGIAARHDESLTEHVQQHALHALEFACDRAQSPMQRLEHALHPWVSFFVMPVFALANAGVVLGSGTVVALTQPVSLGIIAGLVLGKQIGITGGAWLAVRSTIAQRPVGVTWRHIYGASWLGGIGFTMSLFIAGLAFDGSDLLVDAKVGILVASLIAGVVGYLLLRTIKH